MGGVQTGRHASDLNSVGADLVGVGTESFRDPLAGARIASEAAVVNKAFPANAAPSMEVVRH
jgi:dihydroorotate dehydrogenase (NAD+) catalytic subunit